MNDLLKGIVISGPTGVGKTDISIILAKKYIPILFLQIQRRYTEKWT